MLLFTQVLVTQYQNVFTDRDLKHLLYVRLSE